MVTRQISAASDGRFREYIPDNPFAGVGFYCYDFDVYQPRNPKASAYYRCVEDHFEQLETVWDDRCQSRFGFWRPYVTDVIRRYLASGS